MLTIVGKKQRFCDGASRRQFLKIGGLALGGMSLPQVLKAESQSSSAKVGKGLSHKGVIMIYLSGGPSHQDMYDLKMKAPKEIRGDFKPIATNVPGIEICQHMPRLAKMMDKFAIIRSLHGCPDQHASDLCLSGYPIGGGKRQSGHPSLGAFLSKLQGPVDRAVPPFVGLTTKTRHAPYSNPGVPGFLGLAHAPIQPDGEAMANMRLNGITADRLSDRKALLSSVDRFRRDADASGIVEGMDAFTERAFGLLTSSKLVEALDLDKEDKSLRDRYGRGSSSPAFGEDAGPHWMDQFLMARRLIEAGVRCVTLSFGSWDRHGANFSRLPTQLAKLDQGITALVQDIHDRGLQDDVSVVAWGEFGRTPKINKSAGRDHWPRVSCGLLAGGGMRTGQVIGSTNRLGEVPKDRPVHYQNVFATLYRQLGIDPANTTVADQAGRPQYLIDHRDPVDELI
ncbi:MAG: DUF1501 domain-containing protein [Planctomycetaceae bacterium]|nr:DUF1501 domain-containing protein [Planctomycetaceae bacterium]MBT6158179.1 DUF1501 domain-containing protein [Planctomycetaceae bacterium]MBT6487657.1 DUF1501 domain-containing protein [Planctomycetaceae bacterium]MBT6497325.1 DUF1501 domain-containing protein [Planctomycetaceae bacterium]